MTAVRGEVRKSRVVLGRKVTVTHRPPASHNGVMRVGRFGGGWNWKVGVQWGGHTVLVSLLVIEIRIDRLR